MVRRLPAFLLPLLAGLALAQPAGSPAPRFAEPNLTPAGVRALAANCATCHGQEGHPAAGSTVRGLAGMPRDEMVRAMALFREAKSPATVMAQIARGFTEPEVAAMADYFARQGREGK